MISMTNLALRVAFMMKKAKKTRAMLSLSTLSTLALVQQPSTKINARSFVELKNHLEDFGYAITESSKEGHYLILKVSSLEGAPALSCTEKVYKELNAMSTEELFKSLNLPESEILED